MKHIDALGLECPAPVLKVKKTLEKEVINSISVLVDNDAARQNVTRFLKSQGFEVSEKTTGNNFKITGKRKKEEQSLTASEKKTDGSWGKKRDKILVMVKTNHMGHGDDELGTKLMASFLKTLKEMGKDLWRIVFLNGGVKFTVHGSGALDDLKELEGNKVSILVCGTCLSHFNLLDKKQVGETTNMLDIVTSLQVADKVINI